jgi:hypothetical protein
LVPPVIRIIILNYLVYHNAHVRHVREKAKEWMVGPPISVAARWR